MLKRAKKIADKNVRLLKDVVSDESPLIGLEPSAILTFRDEYPEIVEKHLRDDARKLGERAIMIEEFICREFEKGKISPDQFTDRNLSIKLHGHCQQKAISSTQFTKKMLSIPVNFQVEEIPSGCCGMAGAFGYEREHYELSMEIGEMVLFPAVRSASEEILIAAPGTSCRHHIKEGTGRTAFHPAEIMYDALLKDKVGNKEK
jgi:Fe-S oxidoreductase